MEGLEWMEGGSREEEERVKTVANLHNFKIKRFSEMVLNSLNELPGLFFGGHSFIR